MSARAFLAACRARAVRPAGPRRSAFRGLVKIEARIESEISERQLSVRSEPVSFRRRLRMSFQRERAQWYAVGAAAAAIFGLVAVSPLSPLRHSSPPAPIAEVPTTPQPAADPAGLAIHVNTDSGDEDHLTASAPVAGAGVDGADHLSCRGRSAGRAG